MDGFMGAGVHAFGAAKKPAVLRFTERDLALHPRKNMLAGVQVGGIRGMMWNELQTKIAAIQPRVCGLSGFFLSQAFFRWRPFRDNCHGGIRVPAFG